MAIRAPHKNYGTSAVQEEEFLRPVIIRLRGILPFSKTTEVQAVLKEVIMLLEERLSALYDDKLRRP